MLLNNSETASSSVDGGIKANTKNITAAEVVIQEAQKDLGHEMVADTGGIV